MTVNRFSIYIGNRSGRTGRAIVRTFPYTGLFSTAVHHPKVSSCRKCLCIVFLVALVDAQPRIVGIIHEGLGRNSRTAYSRLIIIDPFIDLQGETFSRTAPGWAIERNDAEVLIGSELLGEDAGRAELKRRDGIRDGDQHIGSIIISRGRKPDVDRIVVIDDDRRTVTVIWPGINIPTLTCDRFYGDYGLRLRDIRFRIAITAAGHADKGNTRECQTIEYHIHCL